MKVALVVGAGTGLGAATAQRLAADGFTVALGGIDKAAVLAVAGMLPGTGHRAIEMDVSQQRSVFDTFEEVETNVGPISAVLIFAAILAGSKEGPRTIFDTDEAEWTAVQDVNAKGTFYCIREMARRRRERPVLHPRIVTVASTAGQAGSFASGISYGASKGAVLAMTKTAARELAPLGITVNAIAPGPIETPMLSATMAPGSSKGAMAGVPLGRAGDPAEVAAAAAFLVSEDCSFVTGATIDVNGGVIMR